MFIDIHSHAYRISAPCPPKFCTPAELLRRYDELGIEIGVLLPIVSPEIYMPQANEDILEMVDMYADRFVAYCNIDPRALTNSPQAPLDTLMRHYKEKGCKGVGEIMPNMALDDPLIQNLFRCAEAVGLPVVYDGSDQRTNDFGLYDDPGLPMLEHSLQKFPDLKIFGHGPVFWSEISRLKTPGERSIVFGKGMGQVGILPDYPVKEEGVIQTLFRRYPNLYGDLSDFTAYNALERDLDYAPKFLEEFADRLCFGTDFCHVEQEIPLIKLLTDLKDSSKISKQTFEKIAKDNAVKLLGL